MSQETYELAYPAAPEEVRPYTYISYGLPFIDSVVHHVTTTFKASRVYIIASSSLSRQTSNTSDLEKALGSRHAGTRIGIKPHTPLDDLVPIINEMRAKDADCLVTLGGSSLTDGAKMIKYALANGVSTFEDIARLVAPTDEDKRSGTAFLNFEGVGNDPTVPIICIPTTLSAAEYSRFSGTTDPRSHKKSQLMHPKMFASLVVLDPKLCLATPEWVWLSTGVRAVDHCTESFCSLDPRKHHSVDEACVRGLRALLANLIITKKDPDDLNARLQCQLAARESLINLLWAPEVGFLGGSHGIGHMLGPLGVGHGQTSCILLPSVLRYNAKVNHDRQETLKASLWDDNVLSKFFAGQGLDRKSCDLADCLDKVFRALEMPRTLKEVSVGRDKLDKLAEYSTQDLCCLTNPIPITRKEQALEILETCLG